MTMRPLSRADVPRALEIIGQHDEDDREWAEETYAEGLERHFGWHVDDRLVGVTGYGVDGDVAWLSWTYVDRDLQGQGIGRAMLDELTGAFRKTACRKAFVSTSDYERDGIHQYESAVRLYESAGFRKEAEHRDYYAPGETMWIFGLALRADLPDQSDIGPRGARLDGFDLLDETEDAFVIGWVPAGDGELFDQEEFRELVAAARGEGARQIYVSFPSTLLEACGERLMRFGLVEEGRLRDYHRPGVDDVRMRLSDSAPGFG